MSTKTKGARPKQPSRKKGSEKMDIDKLFDQMDLNHDGRISVRELSKAARLIGFNPTIKEAEEMIADCNPAAKGYVSKSEFKKLFQDQQADLDGQVEQMTEAFKVFDKDNSGTITADEIRAVLRACGEDVGEEEINRMLEKGDIDGDGNIDIEEFAALMCDTG